MDESVKIGPLTLKLLEENKGKCFRMLVLDVTLKAKATKAKIDGWYYIKLKASAQQESPEWTIEWDKIFSN